MKKYLAILALSVLFFSCGGNTEKKTEELTPEQEETFVKEEIEVIDSSVNEVKTVVKTADQEVEKLLKDI